MSFNIQTAKTFKTSVLVYGMSKNNYLLPHINLSNQEKEKLNLNIFTEEPKYLIIKKDENDNEYKVANIELYFRVKESNIEEIKEKVYPINFFIENRLVNQSGTGKFQYINKIGETAWLMDENDTTSNNFLTNREGLRRAYKGEANFMENLKSILHITSGIEAFDWNKVFNKNDFSEIKKTIEDIKKYLTGGFVEIQPKNIEKPFAILFYIVEKTKEDNGNINTYYIQNVYTKSFSEKGIKKQIEQDSKSGYPLKGHYTSEGIIPNNLVIFDKNKITNNENNIEENIPDLPF